MTQRKTAPTVGGAGALLEPGTWDQLRLTWRLLRDSRVAPRLKLAVPLLAALYLISPIDLLPDLLIGIGQVDDLGVIGLALLVMTRLVPRLAPTEVVDEHLAAMGRRPAGGVSEARRSPGGEIVDARFRVRD